MHENTPMKTLGLAGHGDSKLTLKRCDRTPGPKGTSGGRPIGATSLAADLQSWRSAWEGVSTDLLSIRACTAGGSNARYRPLELCKCEG